MDVIDYLQHTICGACQTEIVIDTRKGMPFQAYCAACEELANFFIQRAQESK